MPLNINARCCSRTRAYFASMLVLAHNIFAHAISSILSTTWRATCLTALLRMAAPLQPPPHCAASYSRAMISLLAARNSIFCLCPAPTFSSWKANQKHRARACRAPRLSCASREHQVATLHAYKPHTPARSAGGKDAGATTPQLLILPFILIRLP